MSKPTLITLTSLLFALTTAACASAPAKAPEAPKPDESSAEAKLLGIGGGTPTNQITPAAPAASAKDDGSDIVPPFSAAKPATKATPKKSPAKPASKKTAAR